MLPKQFSAILVQGFHAGIHMQVVEGNTAGEYSTFRVIDVATSCGNSAGATGAFGTYFLPFVILHCLDIDDLGEHCAEHQHDHAEYHGKDYDGFFYIFAHSR